MTTWIEEERAKDIRSGRFPSARLAMMEWLWHTQQLEIDMAKSKPKPTRRKPRPGY